MDFPVGVGTRGDHAAPIRFEQVDADPNGGASFRPEQVPAVDGATLAQPLAAVIAFYI